MKKTLIRFSLFIAILALISMSCSFTVSTNSSSAAAPTTFADKVDKILLDNGFDRLPVTKETSCRTPCVSYINYQSLMVASVYNDGTLTLGVRMSGDSSTTTDQATILINVLDYLYPQTVTDWIVDHTKTVMDADQTGTVDQYNLAMSYSSLDNGGHAILIIIMPTKPATNSKNG